MKIYGIYGKDDGLYSAKQVSELERLIGKENLYYLDHCSHSVFADQQKQFLDLVSEWAR